MTKPSPSSPPEGSAAGRCWASDRPYRPPCVRLSTPCRRATGVQRPMPLNGYLSTRKPICCRVAVSKRTSRQRLQWRCDGLCSTAASCASIMPPKIAAPRGAKCTRSASSRYARRGTSSRRSMGAIEPTGSHAYWPPKNSPSPLNAQANSLSKNCGRHAALDFALEKRNLSC